MRKLILTAAAATALSAMSLLPIGAAQAMTAGAAASVRAAAAATNLSDTVACWRPCPTCRVRCRGPRVYGGYYGPNYGAYPYGYYGGYYGPGVGVYGPGFGIGIGVGPRWGW